MKIAFKTPVYHVSLFFFAALISSSHLAAESSDTDSYQTTQSAQLGTDQLNVESNTTKDEMLVVWGTKVNTSSLSVQKDALAIKQADHISDLLRTVPGVDVGGAHSLNQRITIRSMDDKDLRISIDGANQNTYMYHHMGNLQIHADILQSVDIEIGTNSVVNGGLGGAVRFETKTAQQLLRQDQQFGARLQTSYGDNYGSGVALTGYGQFSDTLDFLVYFNSVKRENFGVGGGKVKDENDIELPGTDGKVTGLEGELQDKLVKFGWDISKDQRLELGYESYQDKGDYSYRPDMGLATDLVITQSLAIPLVWPTKFSRDTLTLNYDFMWSDYSLLKVALFSNQSNLQRDETGWTASVVFAGSAGHIKGKAQNKGLNILGESELENHVLTYGIERIQYDTDFRAEYLTGIVDISSEKAVNSAIYFQDSFDLLDNLSIISGLRYDSYDLTSKVVEDKFNDVTFSVAGELKLTNKLLAKLSSTQLFKGPEIGEVFIGAGLSDTQNSAINAEEGINTELSFAYGDSVLGAELFSAGITFFKTSIHDYIYDYATPPPEVGGRFWKDNIGDMNIDGIEIYLGYDIGNLQALFTFSKAESKLDAFDEYAADFQNARLDRQQGNTISFNLDYEVPQWDLTLHWDLLTADDVGIGVDLDGATLNNAKDGYTVNNISIRWLPEQTKGFAITAGIDNIFDEFYASQSSRTGVSFHPRFGELYLQDFEPGRNIKLTVSYEF